MATKKPAPDADKKKAAPRKPKPATAKPKVKAKGVVSSLPIVTTKQLISSTEKKPALPVKNEKKSVKIKGCGRGGKREGAGRKPGSRNKITLELQTAAKEHAPDALATLVRLAKEAESEAVQCTAAQAILDRAFGRPRQAVDVNPEGLAITTLTVSSVRDSIAAKLARLHASRESEMGMVIEIEAEPCSDRQG